MEKRSCQFFVAFWFAAAFVATGCEKGKTSPADDNSVLGTAVLQLRVPSDTQCIEVTAEGEARTAVRKEDVAPGSEITIPLNGLPLGDVVVTGAAYSESCDDVDESTVAVWITEEPAEAFIEIDPPATVILTFVRNGQAIIDGTFEEDLEDAVPVVVATAGTPSDVRLGDMVVDPETGYIYAVGAGTNIIYVLNSDLEEVDTITTTGTEVLSVDIDPSPASKRLFVSLFAPASVEIYDLTPSVSLSCVTTGAVGNGPHIGFNPVNNLVYTASTSGLTLIDSDCNTGPLVDVGGSNLADVAVDTLTNRVYIPLHHAWQLLIVDGADNDLDPTGSFELVDLTVQGDPLSVAADPFQHRVYVGMNVGGEIERVDADPALGLPPLTQESLVVGHAPAILQTNPALGRVYISIRNFNQIATVTNGEVTQTVSEEDLDMTPNTLAVDTSSHCFYVANHHTDPENKIVKLCEPAEKQLGIAALKTVIKRCVASKAYQKILRKDLQDVIKSDGAPEDIDKFNDDVDALAGDCEDELIGLSESVWDILF